MRSSLFGSIQEEVVKDAESVRNQQQQHLQQHSCTLDECFKLYTKEEQVRLNKLLFSPEKRSVWVRDLISLKVKKQWFHLKAQILKEFIFKPKKKCTFLCSKEKVTHLLFVYILGDALFQMFVKYQQISINLSVQRWWCFWITVSVYEAIITSLILVPKWPDPQQEGAAALGNLLYFPFFVFLIGPFLMFFCLWQIQKEHCSW